MSEKKEETIYSFSRLDLESEKWKDIDGYEGLYEISTLGRCKTHYRGKKAKNGILKPIKESL